MSAMLLTKLRNLLEDASNGLSPIKTKADSIYTRIGAPALTSISADIAAAKTVIDNIYSKLGLPVGVSHAADLLLHYGKSKSSMQAVIPTLANGVTVTGAAGAWVQGAQATIVAANNIASDFYVDGVFVEATPAAGDIGELKLYYGATPTSFAVVRIASFGYIPLPAKTLIPANSQIVAKLATKAGGSHTADISIHLHIPNT